MTTIEQLEKLLAEATPAPWRMVRAKHGLAVAAWAEEGLEVVHTSWHASHRKDYPLEAESFANIELIVAAVNSLPSLIAQIKELQAYKDELLKIAADVGEEDDPFAAWEAIQALGAPE
jgi:hypothetical protein